MGIIWSGIGLGLLCVVLGALLVAREVPRLKSRATNLQTSLAVLPFARAVEDLERLQRSLEGLQALKPRVFNIQRLFKPGK